METRGTERGGEGKLEKMETMEWEGKKGRDKENSWI